MGENSFQGTQEYVASEELMASVNIAIALKKPLLIKGEPGTGKTMLAEAVAKALGKKLPNVKYQVSLLDRKHKDYGLNSGKIDEFIESVNG